MLFRTRDKMAERILIAGIGNIFFGDDAFGVRLARRLETQTLPAGVEVVDFGIRGIDLAYALLDDYRAAILLDATPRGGEPGTLYLIEVDANALHGEELASVETHNINPIQVLAMVEAFGGQAPPLWVVGCEPSRLETEDFEFMSLSPPVESALDEASAMVSSLVSRLYAKPDVAPAIDVSARSGIDQEITPPPGEI